MKPGIALTMRFHVEPVKHQVGFQCFCRQLRLVSPSRGMSNVERQSVHSQGNRVTLTQMILAFTKFDPKLEPMRSDNASSIIESIGYGSHNFEAAGRVGDLTHSLTTYVDSAGIRDDVVSLAATGGPERRASYISAMRLELDDVASLGVVELDLGHSHG